MLLWLLKQQINVKNIRRYYSMFAVSKFAILKSLKSSTALVALVAASFMGSSASAKDYTKVISLGDSLTDTGNLFKQVGQPGAPYYKGRLSNGLTWAEIFAKQMEAISNNPGAANLNVAFAGAYSGVGGAALGQPPGFLAQVSILRGAIAAGGTAPLQSSDLLTVWIGANDYLGLLTNPAPNIVGTVATVTGNTAGGITALHNMGGRNFLVFNLPNLGATPRTNKNATASAGASAISGMHNAALFRTVQGLSSTMQDSDFIFVDIASLLDHIIANPADYGFSNVKDACLLTPACAGGTKEEQNKYLFWDDIHPTTRTHAWIAKAVSVLTNTDINLQEIASLSETGLASARGMSRMITSHMSSAKPRGFSLSALGSYTVGDRDKMMGRSSYDYKIYSYGLAVDYAVQSFVMGLSYIRSDGDISQASGGGYEQKSWQMAAHISSDYGGFKADAQMAYGTTDYDSIMRHTGVGSIQTNGITKGSHFTAAFNVDYTFKANQTGSIKPFAGFRYIKANVDAYKETGGIIFNLDISGQEVISQSIIAGVKLTDNFEAGGFFIQPRAVVAYEHEMGGERVIVGSLIGNTARAVTVRDTMLKDHLLSIGVGADLRFDSFTASLDYVSELGIQGGRENQFMLRFTGRF